jgi:hypothetical protein
MTPLEVIPLHAPVSVGPVEGVILAIRIDSASGVRYEVGYWDAKTWKETWFDADLVKAAGEKQRIGFAP